MITSIPSMPTTFTGFETPSSTRLGSAGGAVADVGGAKFGEALTSAVQSVEGHMADSDQKLFQVASGQDQDYAGMMVSLEEANISLRAMGSVRDKLVEAYQAIWNMPV